MVELGWDGLSWARKYIDEARQGTAPKQSADVLTPGDIIYLEYVERETNESDAAKVMDEAKQADEQSERGYWLLTQVPAVSGALVSLNPSNGAILASLSG